MTQARRAFRSGEQLFKRGRIKEALLEFNKVGFRVWGLGLRFRV
jgi:hypothetical protein